MVSTERSALESAVQGLSQRAWASSWAARRWAASGCRTSPRSSQSASLRSSFWLPSGRSLRSACRWWPQASAWEAACWASNSPRATWTSSRW